MVSDFCDGVSRRGVIQAGLGGLAGLSLPELLRLRTAASEARYLIEHGRHLFGIGRRTDAARNV